MIQHWSNNDKNMAIENFLLIPIQITLLLSILILIITVEVLTKNMIDRTNENNTFAYGDSTKHHVIDKEENDISGGWGGQSLAPPNQY